MNENDKLTIITKETGLELEIAQSDDREKLEIYLNQVLQVPAPNVKSIAAKQIMKNIAVSIQTAVSETSKLRRKND